MTLRGLPRPYLLVAAMCIGSAARAGIWATEPVLGLAADYSTNPGQLFTSHTAETRGAVLIDAPTSYHGDGDILTVLPSFRITDKSGYSSVASNYAHLTVKGEIDSERDTLTVTGQFARDSSLYYNFSVNGSSGVRHDTSLADVQWVRMLTERLNFNFDIDSSRVVYGQPSTAFITLTPYRYTSAAPSLAWSAGERTTLTLLGSTGLYDTADGTTKSLNSDLELGVKRQLNEIWTVNVDAGYSRESNVIDEYFGPFLLGRFKATNTGTVFKANIARQGTLLLVTAEASRSLVPTGFAFLSLQDSYQLRLSYPWTERWTYSGHVRWLKSSEPEVQGPTETDSYFDLGVSAVWQFTEKWSFTFSASKLTSKYTPPGVSVASTGASIELSRRFDRITWQ